MALFNEKEHLQNIAALSEELAKILKNAVIVVHNDYKEISDLNKMAKNLIEGKRTPLLEMNPEGESRQGKYVLTYPEQKPTLHFIEKQQTLQIPAALKQFLSQEDMDKLQQFGNANRVIYVDEKGVATPKYVSLDKETNTLATMSASKLSVADTILGVTLTEQQKENLKQGNPILLKGLTAKDGGENWDAVVSVDALNRGLSFKKVDLSIPKEILGVKLDREQQQQIKHGETVLLYDLRSAKTGNLFSAAVSLKEGHLELKPIQDAPKKLLGLELSEEQRNQLRVGESVSLAGLTSNKTGKLFDASITLDADKGIVFNFKKGETQAVIPTAETKTNEKALKIPLLEDAAYTGLLKKTPSIALDKKGSVNEVVEAHSKDLNIPKSLKK